MRQATHRGIGLIALGLGLALGFRQEPALADELAQQSQITVGELPPLPSVPRLELPPPTAEELELLDGIVLRLLSPRGEERKPAAAELRSLAPKYVAALSRRLKSLADKCDREAMKSLLQKLRHQARDEARDELQEEGVKGKVARPDYLDVLVEAGPKSGSGKDAKPWQDLVTVLGISRALSGIASVEAVRELIEIYTRFGEFLRVDTQLSLAKLGDRAVAALIEARRHKAEKVARWADKQLDALGKAIPSEAVQASDPEVLGDILRAFGRIRDPDAARILVSFANTERAQVRDGARDAVVLMGDVGNWQLRDAYENVVGKRPPRDWTWDRTARELFAGFDAQRLALVRRHFDQGLTAWKAGKLADMRVSFNKVLARSPSFARRGEMAPGYQAFALQVADSDPEAAIDALRRAERLATTDTLRNTSQSLRLILEAERLQKKGIVDRELVRRALELDPNSARAHQLDKAANPGPAAHEGEQRRWTIAEVIAGIALLGMLLTALLPRWIRRPAESPKPGDAPAESSGPHSPAPVDAPDRAPPQSEEPPAVP